MAGSRTGNSIKNSLFALCEQGIYTVMSFICRTVFINCLGRTYLGFSGLFSDVLTLLSLAEMGVGTAITYFMYKPAAQKDYKKLGALFGLYKKIYLTIGPAMTIVGLCFTPFLEYIISDIPDIPELPLIYILYLLNTTGSYFFAYKKSILITDQRNYIASTIYVITVSLMNIIQIVVLLLFRNFIAYLLVQLIFTLANNIAVSVYVDKHYPEIIKYSKEKLQKEEQNSIFDNIKAMFMSRVSSAVVTSTDNLLISTFVSTVTLGLYSNYTLFVTMLRTVTSKIFEALHGSVGNLIATEDSKKTYDVFEKMWFVNFWIIGFSSSALFVLVNPFITLWVGESYLLGGEVVLIICLNMYMRLMRNTFITFTDTFGLFKELKKKCICEAIINLVVSLVFVAGYNMGIFGVLLGTFISNLLTNFWYEPYLLYVKKFKAPYMKYYVNFIKYFVVMIVGCAASFAFCNYIILMEGWIGFILKVISCIVIINGLYVIVFCRTKEFKALIGIVKTKFKRSGSKA